MLTKKGLIIRYIVIVFIQIVILILVCPLVGHKETTISPTKITYIDYEVRIYKMGISENAQRDIWKLCRENDLSYELVLAIYQIEGNNDTQIDSLKVEIENLLYLRNYWAGQGFSDEIVFDLMLLSRQRGIEGCKKYMEDNESSELDEYVQKVTKYKYYLEQIDSNYPTNNKLVDDRMIIMEIKS